MSRDADPLSQVAVVMPAYAEEGLPGFVEEIAVALTAAGLTPRFVVVDDHSPVAAADQLRECGVLDRVPVTVSRNDRNRGHGPSALRAYRLGLSCGATSVVHVDGDGQFDPDDVRAVVLALRDDEIVHGRRRRRRDPWYRKVISASLRVALGSGSPALADLNCPLRAYRADALAELLDQVPSDSLVPHVHLSRLAARGTRSVGRVEVRSLPRRGNEDVGTMWRHGRSVRWLPPRRLIAFCAAALLECISFRPAAPPASLLSRPSSPTVASPEAA